MNRRRMTFVTICVVTMLAVVSGATAAQEQGRARTATQRAARDALASISESTVVQRLPSILEEPGYRYFPFEPGPEAPGEAPNSVEDQIARSACVADAVVVGRLSHPKPFLTEDAKYILTEYELAISQGLRGMLRPNDAVSYVRPGGKMLIDGRLAEVVDAAAPTLETGKDYLFFLRRVAGADSTFTPILVGREARWIIDTITVDGLATTESPRSLPDLRSGMDPGSVRALIGAASCR